MDEYSTARAAEGATTRSTTVEASALTRFAGVLLLLHLVATLVHTGSHVGTGIFLGPLIDSLTILTVYVLPILGFGLLWRGTTRTGAVVFTIGMAGSLLLGGTFHYLLHTPDHVAQIPAGPWQAPFRLTALATAVTDSFGTAVGVALLWATTRGEVESGVSNRIGSVAWTGFRPLTRLVYWFSRRWFGAVPASVTVMAHHRGVLLGATAFEMGLVGGHAVDDRIEALAVQKAAMEIGCPFCVDVGAAEASKLGITDEQLNDLAVFEESEAFSERERLALRYAVAASATPAQIPDELFVELADHFDEAALVELTAAIAWENYRGRFNHAFGLESQGFSE